MPDDVVKADIDIDSGRLVRVLSDWCAPFPGYHLYYPHRRQTSPAFAVFVEALRYRPRVASARNRRGTRPGAAT